VLPALLAIMALRANVTGLSPPGIAYDCRRRPLRSVLVLVKPLNPSFALRLPSMWPGAGRSFWSLLAPENCIIGIVCVVYLALVFLLYPESRGTSSAGGGCLYEDG